MAGLPKDRKGVTIRLRKKPAPPVKPASRPRRRWLRAVLFLLGIPLVALTLLFIYYWMSFSRMLDERFSADPEPAPRLFARPMTIRQGQSLSARQLIDRLNDLGYAQRTLADAPGEFAVLSTGAVVLVPRGANAAAVHVTFSPGAGTRVLALDLAGGKQGVQGVTLEAPLITALASGEREKRRNVPLASIPPRMIQAVLAIEDRRFYEHPGLDPIGIAGAALTNFRGTKKYTSGGSTITQQFLKNTLLTPEKTKTRKAQEAMLSLVLETRLTKDQILELYLNDVDLGQRGSFAIRGVAEASRLFFGKDVSNVSLAEAATIAGIIQAPSRHSPFRNPANAKDRRNVVLRAMVDAGYISDDAAVRASREPLVVVQKALDAEAPYFVDYITEQLRSRYEGMLHANSNADVYTTIDLHLQRVAQEALRDGLARVDELLKRRRRTSRAEGAVVMINPKTGEILAMAGGRNYSQSQYNRAVSARRQPGSVFKPFVYLAAFERGLQEGRTDLTPASTVLDEPTTFMFDGKEYAPTNYGDEYDGVVTFRRALAMSRNVAAVKVAEAAGLDRVAGIWQAIGSGTAARPYPSIALGVFEASPLEIAYAYTPFANLGRLRPLTALLRVEENGQETRPPAAASTAIARPETTFLVTNMMRSVINEGTGSAARRDFTLDAAGKSGTTNDLRDAWFIGFTPELLTVVWVGFDDNQPIGLSGTQAALPIWTAIMARALAGHADQAFAAPDGIVFVEIDRDTGKVAGPFCTR
ncbi:MAG: PBP1A family penicillin-binding protein, partial [Acidobacteriota bacterium]|nr:PBP1A family penicillin-binding protein [Acidobacteriota bacterium]